MNRCGKLVVMIQSEISNSFTGFSPWILIIGG